MPLRITIIPDWLDIQHVIATINQNVNSKLLINAIEECLTLSLVTTESESNSTPVRERISKLLRSHQITQLPCCLLYSSEDATNTLLEPEIYYFPVSSAHIPSLTMAKPLPYLFSEAISEYENFNLTRAAKMYVTA